MEQELAPSRIESFDEIRYQCQCVYADPPWRYDNMACAGGVKNYYPTMSVEAICDLPVWTLVRAEAHLWLWTTWPKIRDGVPQRVMRSWGFRWVGEVLWVKPGLGIGRWMRPSTEVLMFGVRGKLPLLRNNQKGHVETTEVPEGLCEEFARGRHSEKPTEFYELIESLSPGPRVELFSRRPWPGWYRWGNEA